MKKLDARPLEEQEGKREESNRTTDKSGDLYRFVCITTGKVIQSWHFAGGLAIDAPPHWQILAKVRFLVKHR